MDTLLHMHTRTHAHTHNTHTHNTHTHTHTQHTYTHTPHIHTHTQHTHFYIPNIIVQEMQQLLMEEYKLSPVTIVIIVGVATILVGCLCGGVSDVY